MSVVDDLKGARDRVERGWNRDGGWGSPYTAEGDVCAMGAVISVLAAQSKNYSNARYDAAVQELHRHLPQCWKDVVPGEPVADIFGFNDHESTTKQDVLAVFDKALADLGGLA